MKRIFIFATLLFLASRGFAAESIFYSDAAETYLEKWESDKAWTEPLVKADFAYKKQRFEAAIQEYEKAVSAGYRQPQGFLNLAHCYDTLGKKEEARQGYERAIAEAEKKKLKGSDLFEAHYRLGVLFGEKKEYAQAVEHLEQARQIESNHTDLLFALGVVNQNQGRFEEAEKYYQAALGIDPHYKEAAENLENLRLKRDLPLDPSELLKRQHLPGKIPLEIVTLDTLSVEELNKKIASLEEKIAQGEGKKKNGHLHYQLALYYATVQKYPEAVRQVELARKARYNKFSFFLLGYVYSKVGEVEKALSEYRQFVRQRPKDPLGHYNLAVLYDNQTTDREKALHHYRRYLQLGKENARDADEVGRRIWLLSHSRNP